MTLPNVKARLTNGTIVTVLEAIANQTYGDVWYKIFVNGSEGYVHSDYIVPSGLYRIGTIVSETKVYADHGFTPLQKCSGLIEGNQVQIIGQEGEWMLIRIAGKYVGYVLTEAIIE